MNFSQKVDKLGALKAQIAKLKEQESQLESELKSTGLSEISGKKFRVSISKPIISSKINWQAIAKKLNPSHQLISANTKKSTGAPRIRCTALKTGSKI